MAIKLEKIKFDNIGLELSIEDFSKYGSKVEMDMTVDTSADYTTNATDYFREAMIGENQSRGNFRAIFGVKDRVKLGTSTFESLIKSGACDFDPSDSEISQKEFEVCPLMVSTSVCIADLEQSFISDQIAKGSANFNDNFAFMTFFYETLAKEHQEELENLTWKGDTAGGETGNLAYLNSCDGLEKKLGADGDVLVPGTASPITSSTVVDSIIEGRNALPRGVKSKDGFVIMAATNVVEAYKDAISENQASGQYYVGDVQLNFQGTPIIEIEGASDDVLILADRMNFLLLQDLISDETGYEVVDFYKTRLDRKIGIRTDFKFGVDYLIGKEIYYHSV